MNLPIKIAIATVLFFVLRILETSFFSAVQPEVASQLALEQFADPSLVTDTAQRGFSNFVATPIIWIGYFVVLGFMFYRDVANLFKDSTKEEGTC